MQARQKQCFAPTGMLLFQTLWSSPQGAVLTRLFHLSGAQVANPKGELSEDQAAALQAAASLFSLEAGGADSGASLDASDDALAFAASAPAGGGGMRGRLCAARRRRRQIRRRRRARALTAGSAGAGAAGGSVEVVWWPSWELLLMQLAKAPRKRLL